MQYTMAAGTVNNPTNSNITRAAPVNALDGRWHMITLTSQPNKESGYRFVFMLDCLLLIFQSSDAN